MRGYTCEVDGGLQRPKWATYQLFYKITDNRQIVAWVGTQATEAYLRVDPLLFTYPLQIVADRWSLRGLAGHQLIVADYRRLKKILHSPTYVQELRSVEERILSSTSGIGESSLKILQRQTTEYRREDYLLYSGLGTLSTIRSRLSRIDDVCDAWEAKLLFLRSWQGINSCWWLKTCLPTPGKLRTRVRIHP